MKLALTIAALLLLGFTVQHPILLVPELLLLAVVVAYHAGAAAIGAARLLRYGGRRARRDWRRGR